MSDFDELYRSFKKGSEHELKIETIVFGGKGLAKKDGYAVFVEQTIPGDVVKVRIKKRKRSFAEAYVLEYIERGKGYVEPNCEHFDYCGGCKWQNLDYDHQLLYKKEFVKDSLQRIGKIENITVSDSIGSEKFFAYRNKMEFSFSDNRWLTKAELGKEGIDRSFALGLHVPGAYDKIIDVNKCHIQDEMFNIILNEFKKFAKESNIPVYNLKTYEGIWRFLMIRKGENTEEYMINVVTSESVADEIRSFCENLVQKYPKITSIVNNLNRRKAQIAVGEEEILVVGKNTIRENLGGYPFEISANSFFQTNTKQAEVMYDLVVKMAKLSGKETVFDMYSGTGTIPIYFSKFAEKIYGFELVESSVLNALENTKRLEIENVEFVLGDVKETMPNYKHLSPDVLIIDPPRTGMHKDVIDLVLFMEAKKFIYVSCNPTTLARDLEFLQEKYQIEEVLPLDMFPHTYHVETIVSLKLK